MTPRDLNRFIQAMRRELRIKYPVRVNLYAGHDVPGGYDGSQRFKRRRHHIETAAHPSRPLLDIIAHELCHARVDELHGFRAPHHGKEFQKLACEAIDAATRLGYIVTTDIYLESIDL
jgi:SprT-like family